MAAEMVLVGLKCSTCLNEPASDGPMTPMVILSGQEVNGSLLKNLPVFCGHCVCVCV